MAASLAPAKARDPATSGPDSPAHGRVQRIHSFRTQVIYLLRQAPLGFYTTRPQFEECGSLDTAERGRTTPLVRPRQRTTPPVRTRQRTTALIRRRQRADGPVATGLPAGAGAAARDGCGSCRGRRGDRPDRGPGLSTAPAQGFRGGAQDPLQSAGPPARPPFRLTRRHLEPDPRAPECGAPQEWCDWRVDARRRDPFGRGRGRPIRRRAGRRGWPLVSLAPG
jgi:hypothetical protein